jgi:hypothetical protein
MKGTAMPDELTREARFGGVHEGAIDLIVRGPLGVVVAEIPAGWLPGTERGRVAFVSVHSYVPRQCFEASSHRCVWLGDQPCWYDGGYRVCDPIVETLAAEGSDAALDKVAELYRLWLVERPEVPRG